MQPPADGFPTTASFLAEFGLAPATASESEQKAARLEAERAAKQAVAESGVSRELYDLMAHYAATAIQAHELSEVKWDQLAKRLGTRVEFIEEAANLVDSDGAFWTAVLTERIKRATAAKVFRDASWERLESMAVNRLIGLVEKNAVRDAGELLAVASHARRANDAPKAAAPGQTVNINFGGDSVDPNTGLPAAGAKMTIDLSPRVASALTSRQQPVAARGGRVIDGEMLSAKDLRATLENRNRSDEDEGESE